MTVSTSFSNTIASKIKSYYGALVEARKAVNEMAKGNDGGFSGTFSFGTFLCAVEAEAAFYSLSVDIEFISSDEYLAMTDAEVLAWFKEYVMPDIEKNIKSQIGRVTDMVEAKKLAALNKVQFEFLRLMKTARV